MKSLHIQKIVFQKTIKQIPKTLIREIFEGLADNIHDNLRTVDCLNIFIELSGGVVRADLELGPDIGFFFLIADSDRFWLSSGCMYPENKQQGKISSNNNELHIQDIGKTSDDR